MEFSSEYYGLDRLKVTNTVDVECSAEISEVLPRTSVLNENIMFW